MSVSLSQTHLPTVLVTAPPFALKMAIMFCSLHSEHCSKALPIHPECYQFTIHFFHLINHVSCLDCIFKTLYNTTSSETTIQQHNKDPYFPFPDKRPFSTFQTGFNFFFFPSKNKWKNYLQLHYFSSGISLNLLRGHINSI